MQYSLFVLTYPLLNSRLVSWAAHRIAETSEHIESEARGRIGKLQKKLEITGYFLPKINELYSVYSHYNDIPRDLFYSIAYSDPTYCQTSAELAAAKFSLMGLKKNDTTPNQQDYALAQQQVKDYVEALQNPSDDVYEYWGGKLSAREKHHLHKVRSLWRDEDGELCATVAWRNDLISWNDCINEYQILTEPVCDDYRLEDRLIGHKSRNSYGVYCLNAYVTMFVDIDLGLDDLQMITRAYPWGKANVLESEIFMEIAKTVKDFELKFACYRTAAGYRLIEMSREWEPTSLESATVLEKLGCDRLYQHLCKTQGTYRARLQPKPWREYGHVQKTVCHWIGMIGEAPNCTVSLKIKKIHDSYCLGKGELA